MTLMAIDPTQSQAHKGNFLQGGKVSNINHQQPNVNRNSHSPPLSKQQQHCNNNNNNHHYNDSSNRKLERSSSDSSSEGSRSSRSSQSSNSNNNSSRYKTELCRPFEESGVCKYGDKCQFAHGSKELRTLVRHPKYKTELCRTFHSTGLCPYGPRCHFIHNSEQTKKKLLTNLTRNSSPTEAKSFNDLYQNNVFLGPMDNLLANYQHQQQRCSSSSFEYKSDLYDAINGYNDKVFYDKDVDNYSFQNGPVLELVPAQELVPPPSPQEREVGFTASMLLPIFNAFQKRAIA